MKTVENEHGRYRSAIDASLQDMHTSLGEMSHFEEANGAGSQIANFYLGKSVFITGATGFMGKVLVEKLLRSCSGVKCIYILLRTKKGLEPKARLSELLNAKIFERIREENPNLLTKLIGIPGDITQPELGISKADQQMLIQDVSIVFHSAATVKFDEPLGISIDYNTLGTRYIMDLCHKMKKLVAMVHVSTAYANCNLREIDEKFYPPPAPPQKIIDMKSWMGDEMLTALTPHLLGNRPNTYTYTKALAEALLAEESHPIPVAIVRPSIVTAAWREPFPGWVDNINGPTGMILASGKGILRTMLFDSEACADLIPVDMVINLMISVAWYTGTRRPSQIQIYHCTSGLLNGIKWGDIERFVLPLTLEYPSEQMFRYPGGNFRESRFAHRMCQYFDQQIPAYAFDGVMRLLGRKPMMVRIYEKLHRATTVLEWFTTRDWHFKSSNVIELSQELKGTDKKTFHFDVRNLHWQSYWKDYILGIRKFILKEDESTLPKARSNLKRIYYTQKLLSFIFLFGLWHFLLVRIPPIQRVWGWFTAATVQLYHSVTGSIFSLSSSPNSLTLSPSSTSASSLTSSSPSSSPLSSFTTTTTNNTTLSSATLDKLTSDTSSSSDSSPSSTVVSPLVSSLLAAATEVISGRFGTSSVVVSANSAVETSSSSSSSSSSTSSTS